jgi:hypothetical protein
MGNFRGLTVNFEGSDKGIEVAEHSESEVMVTFPLGENEWTARLARTRNGSI